MFKNLKLGSLLQNCEIGEGVSGSPSQGPSSVNHQRPLTRLSNIFKPLMAQSAPFTPISHSSTTNCHTQTHTCTYRHNPEGLGSSPDLTNFGIQRIRALFFMGQHAFLMQRIPVACTNISHLSDLKGTEGMDWPPDCLTLRLQLLFLGPATFSSTNREHTSGSGP